MINPDSSIEEETPITSLSKGDVRWLMFFSLAFVLSLLYIIYKGVC
jgi:hypothetical protein